MTATIFSRLATELKSARQRKKISRQKAAQQLHIPLATLVQIENPASSTIPDSYMIGLYRRYGQTLDMDRKKLNNLLAKAEISVGGAKRASSDKPKQTVFIFSTLQKAVGAVVATVVVVYASWLFGVLFAPPALSIDNLPERSVVTDDQKLTVTGRAATDAAVSVNGDPITLNADGSFSIELYLQEGFNGLEFSVSNNFSRQNTLRRIVFFEPDEKLPQVIDEQG